MANVDYCKECAVEIAKGVCQYCGVTYVSESEEKTTETVKDETVKTATKVETKTTTETSDVFTVKVIDDSLNIRKGAGTEYDIVDKITNHGTYTITKVSGNWGYLKSGAGWICITDKFVTRVETKTTTTTTSTSSSSFTVKVIDDYLNIRKGAGTEYDVVGKITDHGKYTITKTSGNWGYLKSGAGWICITDKFVKKLS